MDYRNLHCQPDPRAYTLVGIHPLPGQWSRKVGLCEAEKEIPTLREHLGVFVRRFSSVLNFLNAWRGRGRWQRRRWWWMGLLPSRRTRWRPLSWDGTRPTFAHPRWIPAWAPRPSRSSPRSSVFGFADTRRGSRNGGSCGLCHGDICRDGAWRALWKSAWNPILDSSSSARLVYVVCTRAHYPPDSIGRIRATEERK